MSTTTTTTRATTTQPPSPGHQQQPPSQVGSVDVSGASFGSLSLYVGDLPLNVNEQQLFNMFSQVAPVVSVRICRDQIKGTSLGYGYVNFSSHQDAASAMEVLNFTPVHGKPMRIMFSYRDPSLRKSGHANVFIKNLDPAIDHKALQDTFAAFGTVLSCKVELDSNGKSKGFGYVQFDRDEAAQNAIKSLDGMLLNDKQVFVGLHVRRQERYRSNGLPKFTNVFVKNLSDIVTDDELKKTFGPFGLITSAVVMKDESGKSRCFGFVNFQDFDAAAKAVENLNGTTHDNKTWYVGRAQRKSEREAELRAEFEQERISRYEKLKGANLYLKNLDDSINDEKLVELFSNFGTVISSKVMLDPHGISKGSGFISFSTPEEAANAISEMNGKMIGGKPLYVAIAQRKEERKARLQAHFAQFQVQGGMAPLPQAPHPFFFGQGVPGLLPHQPAGFGVGIRPGTPNFTMPYHPQRQGQRFRQRRYGIQFQQQQVSNRNGVQSLRYLDNGLNGFDPSMGSREGPMHTNASGMPMSVADFAVSPKSTLASILAAASPDHQRLMLGESLYPLVERLEGAHAAKVTGMLLEMDQTEVLHLLESPDALKKKVGEAIDVLHSADVSNQLGSLSVAQ